MQQEVSKGEFARIIGVSPGRVSQYLAEGKISPAALSGVGRNAKIRVDQARADLRLTLDVSQRLGNGIETRLDDDGYGGAVASERTIAAPSSGDHAAVRGPDHEIKLQKLEQLRRANRNGAIAEAKDRGTLIETDAARAEKTRVAASMLDVFEGGINDFAAAIAAEFGLPQRDVKHVLRKEFRKVRERAAKQMMDKAIALPEFTATALDAEETEQTAVT